jgi:hypothetical protein
METETPEFAPERETQDTPRYEEQTSGQPRNDNRSQFGRSNPIPVRGGDAMTRSSARDPRQGVRP